MSSVIGQRQGNTADERNVEIKWGIRIPLRDGVNLHAILYLPRNHRKPSPAVCTLTPYVAQSFHNFARYFAQHGLPFLIVDVRGRGNSEGEFQPMIREADDGYDVVQWLASQPYCDGKVGMWGGSYAGYNQWASASRCPASLGTIVPVASVYPGLDFPLLKNVPYLYLMQWLTLVSGHTSQEKIFTDSSFWDQHFLKCYELGKPFKDLDSQLGNPSAIFQEWVSHPERDKYWEDCNPTSEEYTKISIPVLTITGIYDDDQLGAIEHYRVHLANASEDARSRHYLIIGPWDHPGTRIPQPEFGGLKFGPESLLDIPKLHLQWYAWTLQGGPRPEFLQKRVAYYVMGAEKWRYTEALEAITERSIAYFLSTRTNPTDVYHSGTLDQETSGNTEPSYYLYNPRDIGDAALEIGVDRLTDQRRTLGTVGKRLIYHTTPFEADTEVSGFFKLIVWLSIDQADTDFSVSVYEVGADGSSLLLTDDKLRARYRGGLHESHLIDSTEPLQYNFERFAFVSREVKRGSRLRLVFGPLSSIYYQRNYNTGGIVAEESIEDSRPVNVILFHDHLHPSVLYVPIGHPCSSEDAAAPRTALMSASNRSSAEHVQ